MKYDSLNWGQSQAINAEYDKRHADKIPTEPDFKPPSASPRMTVETDFRTDIYCRMNNNKRHHSEANGELRLVGSGEHLIVGFKESESIRLLISELKKLADDIDAYNEELNAHLNRQKQYKQDIADYEKKREKDLREALKSGKYTGEQIDLNMDDIPF